MLPQLIALTTNKDVGPNVRASAVDLLDRFVGDDNDGAVRRAILTAAVDPVPMVRAAATRVMREDDLFEHGAKLLTDESRLVRDRATIRLSPYPRERLPRDVADKIGPALAERIAGQQDLLDTPAANDNLGTTELNRGNFAEAIDYFRRALKIQPQFLDAAYLLSQALERGGRGGEVEPTLRDAIKEHDRIVEALRRELPEITSPDVKARRERYLERSTAMGALLRFDLALKLAENSARYDEAIETLRETLKLDPNYPRAAYNLGELLKLQGRLDEAETQFRAAIKLDPNAHDASLRLAETLILAKKPAEAETLLNAALNRVPEPAAVLLLADIYIARKEWAAAEKLLNYSYERFRAPQLLAMLRGVYLSQGKTDDVRRIERLLQSLPRNPARPE
ncbi:MAG: tetratricopeptide repeat protein [Pirellulales bacterium]